MFKQQKNTSLDQNIHAYVSNDACKNGFNFTYIMVQTNKNWSFTSEKWRYGNFKILAFFIFSNIYILPINCQNQKRKLN